MDLESCMVMGTMAIPRENHGNGDSLKYRGSRGNGDGFCGNTAGMVSGSHGITAGAVSPLKSAA